MQLAEKYRPRQWSDGLSDRNTLRSNTMYCEHCGGNDCGVCRAHGDGRYQTCECQMGEMARLRQAAGKPALHLPGREIYQPHDNSTALSAAVVLACAMASLGLLVFKIFAG